MAQVAKKSQFKEKLLRPAKPPEKGEPQLALDYLQRSLTIDKNVGNKDRESDILNAIGNVYLETSSYQKALLYYQQAVSLSDLPNARIRKNIGIAYAGLGEYDQALVTFKSSTPNLDLEKPTLLSNNSVLQRVAWIYAKQGKLEKAKIFYESVLKLYRERGIEYGVAVVLTGLGDVYYKLNDRLHLLAEPYCRYNFSPMNKEMLSLQEKFTTIGLRLGIRLDLY